MGLIPTHAHAGKNTTEDFVKYLKTAPSVILKYFDFCCQHSRPPTIEELKASVPLPLKTLYSFQYKSVIDAAVRDLSKDKDGKFYNMVKTAKGKSLWFPSNFRNPTSMKERIVDSYIDFVNMYNRVPTSKELVTNPLHAISGVVINQNFGTFKNIEEFVRSNFPFIMDGLPTADEKQKEDCLLKFSMWCKENKRIPESPKEHLKEMGLSSKDLDFFEDYAELRSIAKEKHPKMFEDLFDITEFDTEKMNDFQKQIKSKKTLFLSTAVTGAPVEKNCLASAKTFCKHRDGVLAIMVADDDLEAIDPALSDEVIILRDTLINKNLMATASHVRSEQLNPLKGLLRITDKIGGGGGSFIVASPKQHLTVKARTQDTLVPPMGMSTGAITMPDYHRKDYRHQKMDYIADMDHVMGGIVVEVESDKFFHFRQVQNQLDGSFVDLGKQYHPNGKVTESIPDSIVWGDIHEIELDENVYKATIDLSKKLKIKKAILHDVFAGQSINHHESRNMILLAQRAMDGTLCLEKELDSLVDRMIQFSKVYEEIVIVESNHDLFLFRYLAEEIYRKDPMNFLLANELRSVAMRGGRPLQHYVTEKLAKEKIKTNITWLKEGDSYYVGGETKETRINVGHHGHKGKNGSRGALPNLQESIARGIIAHNHGPEIWRDMYRVGCSCDLVPGYTRGNPASTWMWTHALTYKTGARQLINFINGKFTTFLK